MWMEQMLGEALFNYLAIIAVLVLVLCCEGALIKYEFTDLCAPLLKMR